MGCAGGAPTSGSVDVQGTDIRHLSSTETPVREGDVLTIVPSIAGGSPAVETELPKLSHAEVLRYSRHLLRRIGQRHAHLFSVELRHAGGAAHCS